MTAFWKNLQGLARGQLFSGGYLSPATAAALAGKDTDSDARGKRADNNCRRRVPWPRLAAYR